MKSAKKCRLCGQPVQTRVLAGEGRYQAEVAGALRTLKQRGKIWEGCRPAFEAGEYYDENLARMLLEGVIVPAKDPKGGYVLPRPAEDSAPA